MKIGKKIAQLRKEKGFTQKEVADFLNVSDKAVSRWESGVGNPDMNLIPKIAKLFGVSADYLFDNDEQEDTQTLERIDEHTDVEPTNDVFSQKKKLTLNLVLGLVLTIAGFAIAIPGLYVSIILLLMGIMVIFVGVGNLILFIMMHNDRVSVKQDCVSGIAFNKPFKITYDKIISAKALSAAINNVAIKTSNQQSETKIWMIKNAEEIADEINKRIKH